MPGAYTVQHNIVARLCFKEVVFALLLMPFGS